VPLGSRQLSAKERLILAVDTSNIEEARRLVDELSEYVGVFKVGLELFMNFGPDILKLFHERGLKLFFDGKFLDIPNTVAKASQAVGRQGVQMFTVHASGGSKMLSACAQGAAKGAAEAGVEAPLALGVTVLTSLSQEALNSELGVAGTVPDQVVRLAKLCSANGVKGIVASAEEVAGLRVALGDSIVIITPGVRPTWADANDQSRIVTPAQALRNGSDYLVIGRPITGAADRAQAAKRIINEMHEALQTAHSS
jgi:orotidine-5'-phosphate decarboxylase